MEQQKNNQDHTKCIYYCYKNFCNRTYKKETKKYGYCDLTEYKCAKKCPYFRRDNWINHILRWLFG